LILAKEQNADLVIMDEILGRRYAKQLGFSLTGTIGILLKLKEKGFIESIKDLLIELTEKGTWLSPKLIAKVIKLSNEE
jgi:predicted nucleic acid-binding protein